LIRGKINALALPKKFQYLGQMGRPEPPKSVRTDGRILECLSIEIASAGSELLEVIPVALIKFPQRRFL
jgi:hypothetical protein